MMCNGGGISNHDRHATGWVSYWTTRRARGRGVASGACRALARWAFDDAGLVRLELGHRVNNPASCRVALAAGFAAEGIERQKLEYDGTRYDVERHARLATDEEPALS
ncbi:GNAT family N-acetyltransferase [Streptomyces sp. NPDC057099]|uniref:GNAT family N-acetyltransferase n=1 Tax=Streptomyces sp. NPDC057099 TaxID=3346019 RepID=UPI003628B10B